MQIGARYIWRRMQKPLPERRERARARASSTRVNPVPLLISSSRSNLYFSCRRIDSSLTARALFADSRRPTQPLLALRQQTYKFLPPPRITVEKRPRERSPLFIQKSIILGSRVRSQYLFFRLVTYIYCLQRRSRAPESLTIRGRPR